MILHIDMDAFYASVEERDQPALKGKPVIVAGSEDHRGVVSAANYEARRYGVHSAMPTRTAFKRCPHIIRLPVRMDYYAQVSQQIHAIFARYTPLIEPLSLDEAFLDVSASQRYFGSCEHIARRIKQDIADELQLVASVGVAPNKFVAKIASDVDKPDGFVVVQPDQVQTFLAPLPIRRLWGVGKTGQAAMAKLNIHTIADIRRQDKTFLIHHFGSWGETLWHLCRGIDDRSVETDRQAKSISNETTFAENIHSREMIMTSLLRLTEHVAFRLRLAKLAGKTVQIKARFPDFKTITRSTTLPEPVQDTHTLWLAVKQLASSKLPKNAAYRLLGVGVSQLGVHMPQKDLFDEDKYIQLDQTADTIREKFGSDAIFLAGAKKIN